MWRNGRRSRLKICGFYRHEGSSPSMGIGLVMQLVDMPYLGFGLYGFKSHQGHSRSGLNGMTLVFDIKDEGSIPSFWKWW